MTPRIFITKGMMDEYVALSYVWGEPQPCTTTENIDVRMKKLDLEELPKTIQDAIIATHRYGLRYLWVDALCILQDSQADKNCEISDMRRIYHDAHLTIVAASAGRVSEGFMQDRPDSTVERDTRVPFLCPDRTLGSVCLSPVWKQYEELSEPVSSRAWCLQERMLSPRSMIYASHTLQYCCQTETVNIGDAVCPSVSGKRLPRAVFNTYTGGVDSIPSQREMDEARRAWNYILEDYSQRNMTAPSDKLVALSGVAAQFQRVWPRSEYLAGIWRHTLVEDLLWLKNYAKRHPRPVQYRAPSWSWAAVDGHVNTGTEDDSRLDTDRYSISECKVVYCSVMLASEMVIFGGVVGGVLQLRAALVRVTWNPTAEMPDLFVFREGERVCVACSYPDSAEESESVEEVWAVPVRWNLKESYAVGLIVIAAEGGDFRRVGYFHSTEDSKDLGWFVFEQLVQVRIVYLFMLKIVRNIDNEAD
ncbi:hypothetical protein JR316_0006608 [Psilocybe cubensis]|uniref:Uncharacterized protein n=2 Tax=Psilocybe cubensis TaxID=181762 RepID=A0ACB8GXR0_PSICU|nr:hypothetical protein JR316_0006608 [Psilocybe cubensis]KAH9480011.1 hypothetical protein JR316_0006608 [Psilocybe cubensis]